MATKSTAALLPVLLLLTISTATALTQDFCVANRALPDTPSGYSCKPPSIVTANDFAYSGLNKPGALIKPFNTSLASAFVDQFPAVNGLGISASRVDILKDGVVPLHTHPLGSELLFVAEGTLLTGFISSFANNNKVYARRVSKGDVFVFPQGLLHFQYNVGNTTAVAFAAYSSANPGLQVTDLAFFANNFPTPDVVRGTFIDEKEVMRLKDLFGGSA